MRDYSAYRKQLERLIALMGEELPGPMSGFATLHKSATADGALSATEKELIALGIASQCDAMTAARITFTMRWLPGLTAPEVSDATGVAVMMGGGPSVVYGSVRQA